MNYFNILPDELICIIFAEVPIASHAICSRIWRLSHSKIPITERRGVFTASYMCMMFGYKPVQFTNIFYTMTSATPLKSLNMFTSVRRLEIDLTDMTIISCCCYDAHDILCTKYISLSEERTWRVPHTVKNLMIRVNTESKLKTLIIDTWAVVINLTAKMDGEIILILNTPGARVICAKSTVTPTTKIHIRGVDTRVYAANPPLGDHTKMSHTEAVKYREL